jgi:hypothetical protein
VVIRHTYKPRHESPPLRRKGEERSGKSGPGESEKTGAPAIATLEQGDKQFVWDSRREELGQEGEGER